MLLVQLPPDMARDDARLDYFLAALPSWIRVAVEFRHPSWDEEDVFAPPGAARRRLLRDERRRPAVRPARDARRSSTSACTAPTTTTSTPAPTPTTTCAGGRTGSASGPAQGRDVYAYFNNDGAGNAVRNAVTLRRMANA